MTARGRSHLTINSAGLSCYCPVRLRHGPEPCGSAGRRSSSPECPARAQRRIFTPARVMSGRHPRKEADSRASDLGTAVSRTGAVDPAAEGRDTMVSAERLRLDEADTRGVPWRRWGPYLSERQWGTVREDYGSGDDTWSYFPHDQ